MPQEKTTYELLRQGKKEGVAILYERYGRKLYGYAVSSWKLSEDDAWELTYKALFQICEKSDTYSFQDEKAFASFLFTVFLNLLRNYFRDRKKPAEETLDEVNLIENTPDEATHDSREMQILKEELSLLQDWERVLLLLRSQDMPYAQIATYTGKSPQVLKVYYGRLKEKLGKKLHEILNNELK